MIKDNDSLVKEQINLNNQRYRQSNKGNAKRGVSPRLKIWPDDLENQ